MLEAGVPASNVASEEAGNLPTSPLAHIVIVSFAPSGLERASFEPTAYGGVCTLAPLRGLARFSSRLLAFARSNRLIEMPQS